MRALLVVGSIVLIAGCAGGVRMQPPEDLAGASTVLEVSDRSRFGRGLFTSEEFDLGPHRVADVDRDWNKKRSSVRDLFFFEGQRLEAKIAGGFSFALVTPEGTLNGECATAVASKAYKFGSWSFGDETQTLGCRCTDENRVVSSLLVADAKAGTAWEGRLSVAGDSYEIRGQKTSAFLAGYRFEAAEPPAIGAVDVTHPGRVWLREGLARDEGAAVACAAAAILLKHKPDEPQID